MAYLLGSIAGALVVTYLLSALFMWAFKKMGDRPARLFVAFGVAFVVMFVLSGFGSADGGPFNPWKNLPFYTAGFAIWFTVQWFALKNRQTKLVAVNRREPGQFN